MKNVIVVVLMFLVCGSVESRDQYFLRKSKKSESVLFVFLGGFDSDTVDIKVNNRFVKRLFLSTDPSSNYSSELVLKVSKIRLVEFLLIQNETFKKISLDSFPTNFVEIYKVDEELKLIFKKNSDRKGYD